MDEMSFKLDDELEIMLILEALPTHIKLIGIDTLDRTITGAHVSACVGGSRGVVLACTYRRRPPALSERQRTSPKADPGSGAVTATRKRNVTAGAP